MSVLMSKDKDPESRKWLLTINNPVEKGFTHEYIKEQLSKDYNNYDTLATVDQLKKSVDNNEMLSEAEIIALRGNINPDDDAVLNPSRKLRKVWKKRK